MARIPPKQWAEMRGAYRRGEGSLRDLAKRFGVNLATLGRRSTREGWEEERARCAHEAQTKAAEKDVESIAAMLSKHRRAFARVVELSLKRLEEVGAGKHVSANMLDTLTSALAKAARAERLAAGIEPAKPVMGWEAAGQGATLRVKRRATAQEAPPAEPPEAATP